MKTGSSKWLKTKSPQLAGFHWQSGYGVFSISPSHRPALEQYSPLSASIIARPLSRMNIGNCSPNTESHLMNVMFGIDRRPSPPALSGLGMFRGCVPGPLGRAVSLRAVGAVRASTTHQEIAQGNALGMGTKDYSSPERASPTVHAEFKVMARIVKFKLVGDLDTAGDSSRYDPHHNPSPPETNLTRRPPERDTPRRHGDDFHWQQATAKNPTMGARPPSPEPARLDFITSFNLPLPHDPPHPKRPPRH